ncbi:MAG: 3-deoxy-7-phosphoheptulonate synthase [Planctomycetota bacterium]|nr:3-deoxy-7-phosphoheptulonate synthase [Planctomycetota bacterium]MDA1113915.1 3-deoxy-7-phosphoheptulonate synthase [Planctomycetota bacterium]
MNLASATALVREGGILTAEQMQLVVGTVLVPGFAEKELAALLVALADRGETASEILGAVLALRSAMVPFSAMPDFAVDTCGTGGDGKDSFNLSTATAVVAAAAGAKVVKHGNRSVSSKCGSADLLDAAGVKAAGAQILRGGAYKPRTSPYSFQGFGVEGLRQLKDAGEANDLPVVSEIMDASQLPAFVDHNIDCLQIGARNMQNFSLLKAIGSSGIPVLLKRGLAGTVDEWLYSAEYLLAFGSSQVMLCERGIRTFETATRNTLDLTVLPLLREWTHLPIVVDPAHAVGVARYIRPLAKASIAAGADGLTVEMHPDPSVARSDADQALLPGELSAIVADARIMAAVTGRRISD